MKKWLTIFIILLLSVMLIACNATDNNTDNIDENNIGADDNNDVDDATDEDDIDTEATPTPEDDMDTKASPTPDPLSVEDVSLSLPDALDIFDDTFMDVQIDSIELENERGGLVYEIDGFDDTNEYTAKINESGEIIHQEQEALDHDDNSQELLIDEYVSLEDALATAKEVSETENLIITSWKLDFDDGIAEYEINFEGNGREVEVIINAETGDRIEVDIDN